jgi:exopolyphosphatase/guanosine-5'-triphosphate,3'-diphosphate pyrophosphatase
MRLACIDIGTNTTRLLVAERAGGHLRAIQSWRAFTRTDGGWRQGDELPAPAIARLATEVAHQMSIARAAGAHRVRVVATAVVRDAPNRQELLDAIAASCGIEVEVLSHEREARLAFLGASRTPVPAPPGRLAVLDIGGGSTELAVGTARDGAGWWASLPVGSASAIDRWMPSDPPPPDELRAARDGLEREFARLEPPAADLALAVGGSAATVGSLVGGELDRPGLDRVLAAIVGVASTEVAARHRLDPLRARVLTGGVLLLECAVAVLGCSVRVGAGGLREGVILEELGPG